MYITCLVGHDLISKFNFDFPVYFIHLYVETHLSYTPVFLFHIDLFPSKKIHIQTNPNKHRTSNFKCDLAFVARIPLKSLPAVLHRVKKSNVFQKALGGSTQTDKNGVAYLDSVTLMLRTMLSDKRVYENVPRQLSDLVVSLHSTIFSLVDNEVLHLQVNIYVFSLQSIHTTTITTFQTNTEHRDESHRFANSTSRKSFHNSSLL